MTQVTEQDAPTAGTGANATKDSAGGDCNDYDVASAVEPEPVISQTPAAGGDGNGVSYDLVLRRL
jgi:hypothetical protein